MSLNKPWKILVGVATGGFLTFPLIFVAMWFLMMMGMMVMANTNDNSFPIFMLPMFLVFMIMPFMTVLQFVLTPFYLIHIIKNNAANEIYRILLAIGLYFIPYLAMPIYFFMYIWPETPPNWAQAAPKLPPAVEATAS
jgi:hypothetical protein